MLASSLSRLSERTLPDTLPHTKIDVFEQVFDTAEVSRSTEHAALAKPEEDTAGMLRPVSPVSRERDTRGHTSLTRAITRAGGQPRTAPAQRRLLPVLPALEGLLPEGGLRAGTTVAIERSTALALALLAGPSQAGGWCAVVGLPTLGARAVAEAGVALERLALVPSPGTQWAAVVAALLDGMDVVAVHPPPRVSGGEARRLAARARERGAVLVPLGSWEGADIRLSASAGRWTGLSGGTGRLRARRLAVHAHGRGAAARPRHTELWLPAAEGGVLTVPAGITGSVDGTANLHVAAV